MDLAEYDFIYQLEGTYWWFVGMRAIEAALLDPLLDGRRSLDVLDAGCGTGMMLEWLARYSPDRPVIGLDYSFYGLTFCRRRGHRRLYQGSIADLPFPSDSFDLINCLEVLDEVGDETEMRSLEEFRRVLRPRGLLFLRVPAYQWLWTTHDRDFNTLRRYRLSEITGKLRQAGFAVERATYANTFLFPLALAMRLLKKIGLQRGSDVRPLPRALAWANPLFTILMRREAQFLLRPQAKLPFGLSAVVVARRVDAAVEKTKA